ncbi:MAG: iron-only hydrogenase system regulator [Clostridiales bacterium]|nr:iron-only hydrogenase system regulator [Candidatus Blautia equi]
MDKRIAVVSIIIYDRQEAETVNKILHEYASYIIGRMGLPYAEKGVSIICVVMDAPTSITSALSGKLGMLTGVTAKTNTAKI